MSEKWYRRIESKLLVAGVLLPLCVSANPEVKNVPNTTPLKTDAPFAVKPTDAPPLVPKKAESKPAVSKSEPRVQTLRYEVPCLTVRSDESHGKISYLPMTFTRTKEDKPLRIMIADDTPSGSGEMIRGSVWTAAITAAMLRNDTMHGVTISIEFSGYTDGPSAGGVTCLAILSAMDGRTLPKDFAMTGTIMPDGTIGVVGGVAGKMQAAAKAGIKRILIPGFLRMDKDKGGKEVDLSKLARELGVELHRVDNIAEAYAVVHHLPMAQTPYVNVRELTALPPDMEEVLKSAYDDLHQQVAEMQKKHPDLKKGRIIPTYQLEPYAAELFYREGRLALATMQMFRIWQTWRAWERAEEFDAKFFSNGRVRAPQNGPLCEYLQRKQVKDYRAAIEKEIERVADTHKQAEQKLFREKYNVDPEKWHGFIAFEKGATEITAQLESIAEDCRRNAALIKMRENLPDEKTIETADHVGLEKIFEAEQTLLKAIYLCSPTDFSDAHFYAKLTKTFPKLKANATADDVEQLFYSAGNACLFAGESNIKASTEQMESAEDRDRFGARLIEDPLVWRNQSLKNVAMWSHAALLPDADEKASDPEYHLIASLKAQIDHFAAECAIFVKYGEGFTLALPTHLLRNAREAAIHNIAECKESGVPCPAAIYEFENAETLREINVDDALVAYWRSSMYAKALRMSFKK